MEALKGFGMISHCEISQNLLMGVSLKNKLLNRRVCVIMLIC